MNMKKISLLTVALVLLIGGAWYYTNFTKYAPSVYVKDTANGSVTTDTSTGTTSTTTPTYTVSDVATHKDATSCYTVISGNVYDVTLWVNLHPGGKGAILSLCGSDGTEKFMNQHKGGAKFMGILARYKIGIIANTSPSQ